MAKQQRRGYSREFKIEAVKAATRGDKSVTQVARELGVSAEQIHRWRREYEAAAGTVRPEDVFRGNGKMTAENAELVRLRREVDELREERDILKKAAQFSAKESH